LTELAEVERAEVFLDCSLFHSTIFFWKEVNLVDYADAVAASFNSETSTSLSLIKYYSNCCSNFWS